MSRTAPTLPDDLDALRAGIDAVDDRLHAALAERAGLVRRVAAAKGGAATWRPAREAAILRRLSPAPPLAADAARAVQRAVIGAFTAMQRPLEVLLAGDDAKAAALAGAHFGGCAAYVPLPCIAAGFEALGERPGAILVVPVTAAAPWWLRCAGEGGPKVLAVLGGGSAFCVGHAPLEPSGDDLALTVAEGAPADALASAGGSALVAAARGAPADPLVGLVARHPGDGL